MGVGDVGVGTNASEGARALALQDPGNVIEGSSRFQQFFLIYAKLMVGLRDSNVKESDTTPLVKHNVVIRDGKPNQEELDWAIWDIWPEIIEPMSMSIFMTKPYTNLALSMLRLEV